MTKVKTQIVRRDNWARLLYVRAQHFTQRRMHQVRRRVIASRGIALFDVDFSRDCVANFQGALFNLDLMNDQALGGRVGVEN